MAVETTTADHEAWPTWQEVAGLEKDTNEASTTQPESAASASAPPKAASSNIAAGPNRQDDAWMPHEMSSGNFTAICTVCTKDVSYNKIRRCLTCRMLIGPSCFNERCVMTDYTASHSFRPAAEIAAASASEQAELPNAGAPSTPSSAPWAPESVSDEGAGHRWSQAGSEAPSNQPVTRAESRAAAPAAPARPLYFTRQRDDCDSVVIRSAPGRKKGQIGHI